MTSGRTAAIIVAAGAAMVLAGLLGGWAATRALSGQSPLTTVTVATDAVTLRAHTDDLGFTAQVPDDWAERRDDRSVSFVSPDGSEELTVARATSAEEVMAGLTAAALGTADLRPDPPQALDGARRRSSTAPPTTACTGPAGCAWCRSPTAASSPCGSPLRAAVPRACPRGCSTSSRTRSAPRAERGLAPRCSPAGKIGERPGGRRLRRMTDRALSDPAAAAAAITQATGVAAHDVAVVLGSGWRPAADVIGPPAHELAMADLPGFVRPTVAGHGGTVRSVPRRRPATCWCCSAAPTSTRATASTRSRTASAPPRPPAAGRSC